MRISNESLQAMLRYRPGVMVKISAEHLAAMAAEILKSRGFRPIKMKSELDNKTMLPMSLLEFYQLLTRWRR